mgnify:CR=1 FL=1
MLSINDLSVGLVTPAITKGLGVCGLTECPPQLVAFHDDQEVLWNYSNEDSYGVLYYIFIFLSLQIA